MHINDEFIVFKKDDLVSIFKPYVEYISRILIEDISKKVIKEIGDGAFEAARKGYFWNTGYFKEFMKETLKEMFFATPEESIEFKRVVAKSIEINFDNWLKRRLDEEELGTLFEKIAKKCLEDEKIRELLSLVKKDPTPQDANHIELLKCIQNSEISVVSTDQKGTRKIKRKKPKRNYEQLLKEDIID